MRLICFWCALLALVMTVRSDGFYQPQTYNQKVYFNSENERYYKPKYQYLFSEAVAPDATTKRGLDLRGLNKRFTKIPVHASFVTFAPWNKITPVLFKPEERRAYHAQIDYREHDSLNSMNPEIEGCSCQVLQENMFCEPCQQTLKKIPVKLMPSSSPHDTSKIVIPRVQKTVYQKAPRFNPQELFSPAAARKDVVPAGAAAIDSWRGPTPVKQPWRDQNSGIQTQENIIPKFDHWVPPYAPSKEQQANILHHKQSLSSDGAFRFEYASDNGLAAGEHIEPDGSRVGAYQYKDPSGQVVQLKYRAGKEGFQIIEGSHLPKSPEPVAPSTGDPYYQHAYQQQKQQYSLQQQFNQQRPNPQQQQNWGQNQGPESNNFKGGNYFVNTWNSDGDNGQYHERDVDPNKPHSFGEGFAFAFQG